MSDEVDHKELMDPVYSVVVRYRMSSDSDADIARLVLQSIPENWVKVDGEWHHVPVEHFISVDVQRGYDVEPKIDWRMEHSLPCRIKGMKDCEIQEVWQDHLESDGYWPKSGRYRIWIEGDLKRTAVQFAHGVEEQIEDGRMIEMELVEDVRT